MGKPWRWRRCPSCNEVSPAGKFEYVGTYRPGWQDGASERQCPECGYEGETAQFVVVREAHPKEAAPEEPGIISLDFTDAPPIFDSSRR